MNQNLVDDIDIAKIKRSKRAELVEMAKVRDIDLEQATTVSEMREVIIEQIFGEEIEEKGVEQVDSVPNVEMSNLSHEQMLAFKKLEWEMEKERWDRERDNKRN